MNYKISHIQPGLKMTDLIEENPYLLLMMQHFEIDFCVGDLSLSEICRNYDISESLFITVANLYRGVKPKEAKSFSDKEILQIIRFLKNSHNYYRYDKYPQISSYIHQLQQNHSEKELELLEKFFNEYFSEVLEHLDYEDEIAFPYYTRLLENENEQTDKQYSSKEYSEHHSDIELKLKDLKKLLLKYVKIDGDLGIRRKLLLSLFELEYDLYIHSLIEETVLIPFGVYLEKENNA